MTKRKPKIKKLPRYDDGGVNPADPNRTVDTISKPTSNYDKYSGYAAMGVSALGNGYAISQTNANGDYKANMYKNAANQTGNAVVSKAVPVMGPIIGAKDSLVGAIAKGTNTSNINPETGETTYKKGLAATGAGLAQPTHTRQISEITDAIQNPKDYGKVAMANLSIASPGIDMAVEAAQNMWGKDKYGESQELIDKNNKSQLEQQDQYNKMVNYYNQQNQSSQPQYSKGGKHKPKIHFVEPTQGNQMYNNAPQYPDDNHTFGDGGVSDGEPNSSIEKEEITVDPQDGSTYKSNSGTHESGNDDDVNLKPGTIILSDKLKPQGSKLTFAALAKPYQTTKEDRVLENDKISGNKKSTAELMKSIKNQKLNQLFQAQEQLKKSKVAEYARKIGVDINSLIQPNEEQGETTPDNEMQEHRYGGKQLPKYGNGLDDTNYINYDDSGNPITAQQQYGQVDDYHGMTRQPVPTMPVDPSVGQAPYYPDRSMKDDYVKESIYDEMGRKSIPPNQSNKINYKPYIGYAGTALSTAGAVYGLATNKQQPTVKPYLTNPRYLNADEALKSERENYLMNKKDFNEISGGNSSLAMSNLIRNKSKATSDRANILENVQNANASIYNRSDEFNIGQKLNADDINRRNQAAYRNMNTKYVGEIGDQLATGAKDYNSSGRDQDFLDFLDREYPGARQKYYKNKGQA